MRRTHECTELKEKIKAIEQEHPKNIAKSRYETLVYMFPSQVVGGVFVKRLHYSYCAMMQCLNVHRPYFEMKNDLESKLLVSIIIACNN